MPVATNLEIGLRWITHRDMAEVLEIEEAVYNTPWTKADFEETLRQRSAAGIVAETPIRVVGYCIYNLKKHRMEINNIAVAPEYVRRRIGTALLNRLKKSLGAVRNTIGVTVRETNLKTQLFLRANRFLATGTARCYYDDTGEDAYEMEYHHETE